MGLSVEGSPTHSFPQVCIVQWAIGFKQFSDRLLPTSLCWDDRQVRQTVLRAVGTRDARFARFSRAPGGGDMGEHVLGARVRPGTSRSWVRSFVRDLDMTGGRWLCLSWRLTWGFDSGHTQMELGCRLPMGGDMGQGGARAWGQGTSGQWGTRGGGNLRVEVGACDSAGRGSLEVMFHFSGDSSTSTTTRDNHSFSSSDLVVVVRGVGDFSPPYR